MSVIAPDPWTAAVARLAAPAATFGLVVDLLAARRARDIASSQAWRNGRRPDFWQDTEVRLILTVAHRQMTLDGAIRCLSDLIGPDRVPSKSAIHRYWRVLDRA